MPTAIEYYNGYEVFPLCGQSSSETVSFNEFRADLSDGYRQQALYGSNTGLKSWNLTFKTLTGGSYDAAFTKRGRNMTKSEYVLDLFANQKVSGTPFIVRSPVNDQNYLAEFVESSLSLERAYTKLFTTGLNLRQVRIPGVSVFDMSRAGVWSYITAQSITGVANNDPVINWADQSGNANHFYTGTTAIYKTNIQNGLPVVRLNASEQSFISRDGEVTLYEAFFVVKITGATFPNYGGLLTGYDSSAEAILVGNEAATTFVNFSLSSNLNPVYEKNGVAYPESDMQAPMNTFGLVHRRLDTGWLLDGVLIGKDREDADRRLEADIAAFVLCDEPLSISYGREVAEHLSTVWNIGG